LLTLARAVANSNEARRAQTWRASSLLNNVLPTIKPVVGFKNEKWQYRNQAGREADRRWAEETCARSKARFDHAPSFKGEV
jgi:hypothetical protein